MTSLYMYYALSFVLVEHFVCHEPIFVLINVLPCFLCLLVSVAASLLLLLRPI